MDVMQDVNKIQDKYKPLLGEKAWKVSIGHSSYIAFEFGKPIEKTSKTDTYIRGEWHLWIYTPAWFLETDHEFMAAGIGDSVDTLVSAVKLMEGVTLQSIDIHPPSFETIIIFDNNLRLHIFPSAARESMWMLYTPDNNVLTIAPGEWVYENADSPRKFT